jgi:predicted nuclease of restriction endonuclease-like (RecB) superfamily
MKKEGRGKAECADIGESEKGEAGMIVNSHNNGTNLKSDSEYAVFIKDIKLRVQHAQIKAAVSVNQELLRLYWEMAGRIVEKQKGSIWGDGFLVQLSRDLQAEFPDMKGFSFRNIKYIRQWYLYWQENPIGQQLVAQIPWGHNLVIISKTKSNEEALFYVHKTIENNWSRAVLTHHIERELYSREGKAITNFKTTLPAPHSDLARQTINIKKYHTKILTAAEVIEELIKLSKEIHEMDKKPKEMGLSDYEYAFYTAIASNDSAKQVMEKDKLRELAVVLYAKVKENASIDWTIKESVKAKLKVIVKRILRQYGYPPDMQMLATETVLKQAELIAEELTHDK